MSNEGMGEGKVARTPTCDRCGSEEAHAVGEGHLCAECFQLAGSSCGGGGIARDIAGRAPGGVRGTAEGPAGTC